MQVKKLAPHFKNCCTVVCGTLYSVFGIKRLKNLGNAVIAIFTLLILLVFTAQDAQALILINEFLADPAPGLAGDANGDGTRHSYEDEFVEIFNLSSEAVNIGNWSISDSASIRHYFDADTLIEANSTFVVFGGGDEDLMPEHWQTASEGYLWLNNGGDAIFLRDENGLEIDFVTYGSEAGNDQSMSRNPEGSLGEWIKHTDLPNANGRLFSPGYLINGLPSQSAAPEPATLVYLAFGLGSMILVRKR